MAKTEKPTIDPKWVINRQGKDFVMYAGLLDLAHREGLVSIETEIYLVGNEINGHMHVVQAKVIMGSGKVFTGIGDASPANVSKMILPSALRMAETRAKARALRDAVNVSMAAIEELAPDGAEDKPTPATNLPEPQSVIRRKVIAAARSRMPDATDEQISEFLRGQALAQRINTSTAAGLSALLTHIEGME